MLMPFIISLSFVWRTHPFLFYPIPYQIPSFSLSFSSPVPKMYPVLHHQSLNMLYSSTISLIFPILPSHTNFTTHPFYLKQTFTIDH